MRILITGHKGYIGMVMASMFISNGHEVVGLDIDLYQGDPFYGSVPEIKHIKKDIRDVTAFDVKGFDAIVHLAALSNDPLCNLNPELTYSINHEASVRLAKLAKKNGITRFLYSSTCSVYGASCEGILTEEVEPHPITPYAHSKLKAEKDIARLEDSRFSPIFLRSATAYGVSPNLRVDLVLNNLVAWGYSTKIVTLKSDGMACRPIVHIEDVSRAFISVLNAPLDLVHNQVYNIGVTGENYQVKKLAQIVRETVPGSRIEYSKDAGPDKRSYQVDFSKLSHNLKDYKPQWNARSGAQQLYDTYRKVGFTYEDLVGPKYKRIKCIKDLLSKGRIDATLRWRTISEATDKDGPS